MLARIVVSRLCCHWSSDHCRLEFIIERAAVSHRKTAAGGAILPSNTSNAGGHRPYSSSSNLSFVLQSQTQSFLMLIIEEIFRRPEVIAYLRHIADALDENSLVFALETNVELESLEGVSALIGNANSSSSDVGGGSIGNLCLSIIEPLCKRLESTATADAVPMAIRGLVRALSRVNCGVSAEQVLSEHLVRGIFRWVRQLLPSQIDDVQSSNFYDVNSQHQSFMVKEDENDLIERLQRLVRMCFGAEQSIPLTLCLSDTAALSRSKWVMSRYVCFIFIF